MQKEDWAEREIKINERLNNINVVKFLSHSEDTKNFYLALEFCENWSLYHLIQKKSFTEYDECREFIRQVLIGVQYLHENEIIHRDLKLGNILLDKNMRVKICDFGVAIYADAPKRELREKCGTIPYLAPEILNKVGAVLKSDIWSVGVMVYYMYKGERPFDRSDEDKDIDRIYSPIRNAEYDIADYDEPFFRQFIGLAFEIEIEWRLSAKECIQLPMFAEMRNLRKFFFLLSNKYVHVWNIISKMSLYCHLHFYRSRENAAEGWYN